VSGHSLSLELLLVRADSLLNLSLRSLDNIVNLGSNLVNLLLSIKTLSNLLISLDESLKLLLEAVILVIEVGHMLVKSIDFRLEVDLVSHHLLGVSLQPIDLVCDGLLILLKFVVFHLVLG